MIPLMLWQGVGIWRSAGRRISEGEYGWSWIARIVLLINLIVFVYSAITNGALNYSLVRAAIDERAAVFDLQDRGSYVVFHGVITEAAAEKLEPLLSAPRIQRLVINASNGGFIEPTLRLAKIISDRKLFVVALVQCSSSCTALLAAGKDRAITPATAIGLHRGTMPGINRDAKNWAMVESYYHSAGMTHALFAKMRAHAGPYDLYQATIRELIAGGFVTQIYDIEDKKYHLAPDWCEAEKAECDRSGLANQAVKQAVDR
jgi:hypothetical protein